MLLQAKITLKVSFDKNHYCYFNLFQNLKNKTNMAAKHFAMTSIYKKSGKTLNFSH